MPLPRDLSPVFTKARDALESVLARYGFHVSNETFYYDAMGSGYIEYQHRAHWLRLSWDGKDGYLWLAGAISRDQHTFPGDPAWKALDPEGGPRNPTMLQAGPLADARIAQLLDQIELFRASKAAV